MSLWATLISLVALGKYLKAFYDRLEGSKLAQSPYPIIPRITSNEFNPDLIKLKMLKPAMPVSTKTTSSTTATGKQKASDFPSSSPPPTNSNKKKVAKEEKMAKRKKHGYIIPKEAAKIADVITAGMKKSRTKLSKYFCR